jgi:restriction endonuclease Mrr
MTVPPIGSVEKELLELLRDEKSHSLSEVRETLANRFKVQAIKRKKMSTNRSRSIFNLKVMKAAAELRGAGFLSNESRGIYKITKAGLKILEHIEGIASGSLESSRAFVFTDDDEVIKEI